MDAIDLNTEPAAHDLALSFIRRMVECGHYTDAEIGAYRGGRADPAGWIDLGGARCAIHERMHSGAIAHVTKVGGTECCQVFPIDALIREAREPARPKQMALI